MCIPGTSRLLQKIHKQICKDSKAINLTHQAASKVLMDSRTSGSFFDAEGFYHTGMNSMLSQPQQEIYSLHRWSPSNTRT